MTLRILIGISSAVILGVLGYLLILAGSALSSIYEAKIIGGILATPGYIIVAPGLLGVAHSGTSTKYHPRDSSLFRLSCEVNGNSGSCICKN